MPWKILNILQYLMKQLEMHNTSDFIAHSVKLGHRCSSYHELSFILMSSKQRPTARYWFLSPQPQPVNIIQQNHMMTNRRLNLNIVRLKCFEDALISFNLCSFCIRAIGSWCFSTKHAQRVLTFNSKSCFNLNLFFSKTSPRYSETTGNPLVIGLC